MADTSLDLSSIEVLTFDCYGTLIDWEAGILAALRATAGLGKVSDDQLLEAYAVRETALEADGWRPYREVLSESLATVCTNVGAQVSSADRTRFGASVADWPAFTDSVEALQRLSARFELGVITNCDDDLFDSSNARLGRPFRWVVTAEQARSYKPAARNFELALERIGRPRERILHVAQSLFHDHVPAQRMGLRTAWIDRRHAKAGFGATPPAVATPAIVAPDMASFADMVLA
jgi:2-haloacid dehalogenase